MRHDLSFAEAVEKADAFRQLGIEWVYLRADAPDLPWDKVVRLCGGNCIRLSTPTSIDVEAVHEGLTLRWSFEIEGHRASGAGHHQFDRARLRDLVMLVPVAPRGDLVALLEQKFLPEVEKRTADIRKALHAQWDSEDCLRGVIAFARSAFQSTKETV